MTKEDLLNHGFRKFNPSGYSYADEGYQLKVVDNIGIKYFINAYWYKIENQLYQWAVRISYNDGASGLKHHALEVRAYCMDWELQDILDFGEVMWDRIIPSYYELYEDNNDV